MNLSELRVTDDQQAGRLLRHCQLARRASAASPVPCGRALSHLEEDEGGGGETGVCE